MLSPSDLHSTLGQGMSTEAAAHMLRCTARTVRRAAIAYGVELRPRHARIRGEAEWRKAFEEHGPSLREMSRVLGIDHRYIARQLERHGIRPTPEGPALRDESGRWVPNLGREDEAA